jgi:hypothetical protein
MLTILPKGVQTKLKIFSCTLNCEYLQKFLKNLERALMGYSGLRSLGKLIHVNLDVENLLWHSPFKVGRTSEIVRFL